MAHVLDVTPTKKAFEAMSKFVDGVVGEAPGKLDHGPGAAKQRQAREMAFGFLHRLYGLAMRHGHAAAYEEMVKAQQVRQAMGARRSVQ